MGYFNRIAALPQRILWQNPQYHEHIHHVSYICPHRLSTTLQTDKKDFSDIGAILIVTAYIFNDINSIIKVHAQKVKVVSKQVVDKTYEEIREQRKGTPSETNRLPT